ncbi:MAG: hypothetical protein C4308_05890 [Chitinophagaceae bacterium]
MKIIFTAVVLSIFFIACSTAKNTVFVKEKPVQPVYVRGHQPASGYQWIEGEWVVKNGKYEWKKGRWVKERNKFWQPGSWQLADKGWYWQPGYWTKTPLVFADLTKNHEITFE